MPRGIPNKKVTEETNKKTEENVEAKTEEKAEEVKEEKTETKKTTRKTTASKTTTAELEKEKSVVDSIYGDLLDMTEREDNFFPSGSLVIDSVLSNGKGIPMGKFISINSESGIGKCVCGDTIINLNGIFQRIDEGDFSDGFTPFIGEILTLNNNDTTSHKYRERVCRVIRIIDQYGMQILCTPDHPVLVLHSNLQEEWVKAKDIKLKDKIIGQGFVYKKPDFDPDFYMRGVYLADGSTAGLHKENPVITTIQEESSKIKEVLSMLGFSEKIADNTRIGKDKYTTLLCEKVGKKTLEYLRFSAESRPDFVTKSFYEPMSYNQLLSKIAGILDTDAWVGCDRIEFCQKDLTIIEDLQKFLSMIGIVGKKTEKFVKKVNTTYFRLLLNLSEAKKLASLTIGLVRIVGSKLSNLLQKSDPIPKVWGNSSEARKTFFVESEVIFNKRKCVRDHDYRCRLNSIAKRNSVSVNSLREMYNNSLLARDYSKVELHEVFCKEEVEGDMYVYDYTIPQSHSFLTNGLVSHNTTCCLHIARNCCSKGYRCLYIDTECGLNRSQLESFSMIPFLENRTFIPKYVRTYRELDDLLKRVQNDENLKFIFIDSLTDIIPDQLIENNISDVNQPALNAVMQSRILAKYKFPLSNAGITTFFVLQNRTKIGMTYTQPTTVQAAGGKSVEYHMDITLELTKKEFLTRTIKGHDKPIPYGAECFLKANKNRHVPPKIPMLLQVIFGKGVSNSGAIANAMVLNGLAKASSKKYTVDYKGEEVVLLSKAKFDAFIKEHLEYYKAIVESCGGIKLIPDSEMIQPVTETNTEDEDSIEELSVEESGYEADEDGIISLE